MQPIARATHHDHGNSTSLRNAARSDATGCENAPDRIRTYDLRFRKPLTDSATLATADTCASQISNPAYSPTSCDGDHLNADLRRVVSAWNAMSDPIRRAVLALVDSVTSVTGTETSAGERAKSGFGDNGTGGRLDERFP
jgi:hypothetical protein